MALDETAFHPAGDDPQWAESACFTLSVPERNVNGFVYFFHDARFGISGGGPALWDPTGEQTHDCLFYDWQWRQPPTGPLDLADFTLSNSLRHRVIEPYEHYRLTYSRLGLDMDLDWTPIMAPHQFGHGAGESAAGHYDQPGRMTGTLVLDGERIAVDCPSMRDRTWGPHRAGSERSGDYLWAISTPDEHWHAITMESRSAGVDKVVGGYLVSDGRFGELVTGQRRVESRSDGAPSAVVFEAVDEHGRSFEAHGSVRTALRWFGWPGRLTYWTLTDWSWAGHRGWGENQEFLSRERARDLSRR